MPTKRLHRKTVEVLTSGGVEGWFQGAMGIRATCARADRFADPRHETIRDTINAKIKKRELFQPLPCRSREEAASNIFRVRNKSLHDPHPAGSRPPTRPGFPPSPTSMDQPEYKRTGSSRSSAGYWNLLDRFENTPRTNLLNTSFNIQEPIVARRSRRAFLHSGVDALVDGKLFHRGEYTIFRKVNGRTIRFIQVSLQTSACRYSREDNSTEKIPPHGRADRKDAKSVEYADT